MKYIADELERLRCTYEIPRNRRVFASILNGDGQCIYASDTHKDAIGYDKRELEGGCLFDYIHPDDAGKVRIWIAEMIHTQKRCSIHSRVLGPNGEYMSVYTDGIPLGDGRCVVINRIKERVDIRDIAARLAHHRADAR